MELGLLLIIYQSKTPRMLLPMCECKVSDKRIYRGMVHVEENSQATGNLDLTLILYGLSC